MASVSLTGFKLRVRCRDRRRFPDCRLAKQFMVFAPMQVLFSLLTIIILISLGFLACRLDTVPYDPHLLICVLQVLAEI